MKIFTKLIFALIITICLVSFIFHSLTKKVILDKPAKVPIFQIHRARTFIHSKEQLKLTKLAKISPRQCNKNQTIAVFINSAAKYLRRRQIQRNTWVSEVKDLGINVYFAVGLTGNKKEDQDIWNESLEYQDIIQFNFIDDYYNNTLKAISILRWIQNYCIHTKMILKTDDDVLVNIVLFLKNIDKFKPGIHGLLYRRVRANRSEKSKWYLPKIYYQQVYYPEYNPGVAYLMTGDIIGPLVRGIDEFSGNVIDIDDAFITGVIANQTGVKRFRTNLVAKSGCWNKCNLFKFGVIFGCNKDTLREELWFKWTKTSEKDCFSKRFTRKSAN